MHTAEETWAVAASAAEAAFPGAASAAEAAEAGRYLIDVIKKAGPMSPAF